MNKIEQVAIVAANIEEKIRKFKSIGYKDWVFDTVTFDGTTYEKDGTANKVENGIAKLAFNYEILPGKEFEILEYKKGRSWHDVYGLADGSLSHMAFHTKNLEKSVQEQVSAGWEIVQKIETKKHENENISDRKYKYVIMKKEGIPFFLKIIFRVKLQTDDENLVVKDLEMMDKFYKKAKDLREKKTEHYGGLAYYDYGLFGVFWDIARKFGRLKNFIYIQKHFNVTEEGIDSENLKDTVTDMINYCFFMLEVIEKQEAGEMK